MIVLSYFVY